MDYEKKYKQLHTFISDLYPFMSEYCKEKVEGFFPELKVSEDERIRKAIIEYLKERQIIEKLSETKVKKNWIAWLEKQGEPQEQEKQQWIDKACEWLKHNIYDYFYWIEMEDESEANIKDTLFDDFKKSMEEQL